MSQKNTPHELYIEQVKTDEKKKKRKYLLLLLLLLLLGGIGGGGLFSLLRSPEGLEYRTFNKTDLDIDKVKGILADKNVRIRILDYERGRLDTINSLEEYRQLYGDGMTDALVAVDTSASYQNDFEREDNASRNDPTGDGEANTNRYDNGGFSNKGDNNSSARKDFIENSGPLKKYKLDIIGKRVAGEILSFIITDYNPSIKYNLDFGNGVLQDAKEITLYMYPASGRFTLNLTATDPQFNRSSSSEYLEIKEKNPDAQTNATYIAEEIKPDDKPIASDWEIVGNNTDNSSGNPQELPVENPDGAEKLDLNATDTDHSANSGTSQDIEQPRSTTPTEQVDTKTAPDFDASKIKEPLTTAQKAPSFPGGTKSMYSFLNQHISYPQQARDYEVEGKVYVQFEVDRGGIIKTPKVVKGLGYGCDEEALRIVKLMPRWEPARHMNQVVPFLYTLPVTFRLID